MHRAAALLRERAERIAMTLEQGNGPSPPGSRPRWDPSRAS
jgi:hypothetical protein